MNKVLFLILLVFSTVTISRAQIRLGVTTGMNTTIVLDKGLTEDPRYNSQLDYNFVPIGFSFGADISKGFGIQLEGIFATQEKIYEVLDIAEQVVGQRKLDMDYVQIPLMFKFMSSTNARTRGNFSLGPQLSILNGGAETIQYIQSNQTFPEGTPISMNADGTYTIHDLNNNMVINNATQNSDGSYTVPQTNGPHTIFSSEAQNEVQKFKDKAFQIAGSFGMDIDVGKYLSLSAVIRASYNVTDQRNDDFIKALESSDLDAFFSKRADLIVGAQIGLNFVFGGNRYFNANGGKIKE